MLYHALLAIAALAPSIGAQLLIHPNEAMKLAFPECKFERMTVLVSAEERAKCAKLAKAAASDVHGVAIVYVARSIKTGQLRGIAYFDKHEVRTKREMLMVAVGADSKLARVEVCAFAEPINYKPNEPFYRQFDGRGMDSMKSRAKIRKVTGATLTVNAAFHCCQRILALHEVLSNAGKVPTPKQVAKEAPSQPETKIDAKGPTSRPLKSAKQGGKDSDGAKPAKGDARGAVGRATPSGGPSRGPLR